MRLHINGIKEGFIIFFGSFLRRQELTRLSGATYLLLGCLVTSLLFKRSVVIAACTFVIVGDTFAALIGQNIKSPKISANKTLLGSLSFLITALLSAIGLSLLPDALPIFLLIIGAVSAAVLEALPLPWNDNFSVPILTGIVMSVII
ncbi:hypothetical protein A2Y85_06700 [candidate division WOR-3 bacterium RBG_13_43_14]|uniref:Phosphatidate cytidylyltransferase n=1 Tax=candidate division WOR-3 bacterium RBG_13_43_14 TaxID=1802590 RepID=A0A1F4UG16_UNCW3|nr:MAG: hypothetical protein A2Y85_06700 [candidate division WOR-3 bacterium RBG_13_43_14]